MSKKVKGLVDINIRVVIARDGVYKGVNGNGKNTINFFKLYF